MLEIAQQFATLLDEAKFDEAAQLLAPECTYHYFEGNYQGRDTVINIYRMHDKNGSKHFDEARNSSHVVMLPDGRFENILSDMLRIGERWHAVHSKEVLTITDGFISHIEHVQLPEESRAFFEFLRDTGRITQSQ